MPENVEPEGQVPIRCGLVMPISEIDGCKPEHWREVRAIIDEALAGTRFKAQLVSDRDDSGIIQATIVQRLADDPIVICDVSARNPNVMFELGLRLAFDKATVVIKDDRTGYPFDTSPLQYLEYPRDLHHLKIQTFEQELAAKLESTYKASTDSDYSTYLKHFVKLKPKKLSTEEVEGYELVRSELAALRAEFATLLHKEERRNASFMHVTSAIARGSTLDMAVFSAALRADTILADINFTLQKDRSIQIENIESMNDEQKERIMELAKRCKILMPSIW